MTLSRYLLYSLIRTKHRNNDSSIYTTPKISVLSVRVPFEPTYTSSTARYVLFLFVYSLRHRPNNVLRISVAVFGTPFNGIARGARKHFFVHILFLYCARRHRIMITGVYCTVGIYSWFSGIYEVKLFIWGTRFTRDGAEVPRLMGISDKTTE